MKFEEVKEFVYLGVRISKNMPKKKKIRSKANKSKQKRQIIKPYFRDQTINSTRWY